MPKYISFDERGVLREREMTCEERVAELTKANAIHIDDVYEAIMLLKEPTDKDLPLGWSERRDTFLAKLAGPR